jgi:hypothetical protein
MSSVIPPQAQTGTIETRGAETDEIQVVRTPPTAADGQLILQMHANDAASGADR